MNNAIDLDLRDRARAVIPGGVYGHIVSAGITEGAPQFMARGLGAHTWDVDGNEYIDLMSSWGPVVVGHRNPVVEHAVRRALDDGDCLNGPTPLLVELAERLVSVVGHADWAMFAKNGTDATTMCVTIARAATGRRRLLTATGAYHGAAPWCTPGRSGVIDVDRSAIDHFTFNDLASVEAAIAEANDVAAIMLSPFKHDAGFDQELVDPAFARGVRALCDRLGIVLILDDVRAGFRLDLAGSWEPLGVRPDLSAWSKAIANGYALAAVTGVAPLADAASSIFVTGSFWYGAASMAASLATIDVLEREQGTSRMALNGDRVRQAIVAAADAEGVGIRYTGPAQMPFVSFDGDEDYRLGSIFAASCMSDGVYLHPRHNWFIPMGLDEHDLAKIAGVVGDAMAQVARAGARA